jgi:hypothetical protein
MCTVSTLNSLKLNLVILNSLVYFINKHTNEFVHTSTNVAHVVFLFRLLLRLLGVAIKPTLKTSSTYVLLVLNAEMAVKTTFKFLIRSTRRWRLASMDRDRSSSDELSGIGLRVSGGRRRRRRQRQEDLSLIFKFAILI